jgi:peptidoglycan hydrolase CwlO-like protein
MAAIDPNLYTVLITAISILGGSAAWRFYEKRAEHKERDDEFIRHDCKDRIAKLEALLAQTGKEKDNLRAMILELTKQVAALSVKVEFLTKENDKLKSKSDTTKKQLNG